MLYEVITAPEAAQSSAAPSAAVPAAAQQPQTPAGALQAAAGSPGSSGAPGSLTNLAPVKLATGNFHATIRPLRITSYNVCYTKLLRRHHPQDSRYRTGTLITV